MNRKQNFIAIFAIALIALGTSLLFSCNADDEEYDFNGAYTMANGMKTRSGEGGNAPQYIEYKVWEKEATKFLDFHSCGIDCYETVIFNVVINKIEKVDNRNEYRYVANVTCNDTTLCLSPIEVRERSVYLSVNVPNPNYSIEDLASPKFLNVEDFWITEYSD